MAKDPRTQNVTESGAAFLQNLAFRSPRDAFAPLYLAAWDQR